ncbi:hypothetical protein BLA60_34000 [Actinophytocola xinjiangensis]|uniref:Erythromycin biosynthesis protein CIII-like C-terminal domain-containing protein n=1 Tax=Actinophytocola xinjiangensis TaxID=485602 RepID=A0A7Z1AUW0_9PSEU|nr:glycosyltransferase [Actinophytocola xinjiangensis]OLF06054.1 hypothetical protein BLA60_34000 [Actinophytocola xinjiangensis]
MAGILIGANAYVGHVTPLLPIARLLVERGHDVRFYTGRAFEQRVRATGARFLPIRAELEVDERDPNARFPERASLSGVKLVKHIVRHEFTADGLAQYEDFRAILDDEPADLMLVESTFAGARWVHEKGGPPWAVLNITTLMLGSRDTAPGGFGLAPGRGAVGRLRDRLLRRLVFRTFREEIRYFDELRQSIGLPATGEYVTEAPLSPFLFMHPTVPAFEFPRTDLPPQVHFLGPILPPPPADFTPPPWWSDLDSGRPVVHVTQGTVQTDGAHLITPTIRALAGEDVLVVATTGGPPVESLRLDHVPDNVRLARFVPHARLLPYVDVMVTNGGYNGIQAALANGVPLVATGRTEDKPDVCARVAWAGVGVDLRSARPSPARIRGAVRRVLSDPGFTQRARLLSESMAAHDAPAEAADLVERLLATGRPVVRAQRPDAVDLAGVRALK